MCNASDRTSIINTAIVATAAAAAGDGDGAKPHQSTKNPFVANKRRFTIRSRSVFSFLAQGEWMGLCNFQNW